MTDQENNDALNARIHGETKQSGASVLPLKPTKFYGTVTTAHSPALLAKTMNILEERGINLDLALKMGWRSTKRSGFTDGIEIPYYRGESEVNTKTRSLTGAKKFDQRAGGDKCFYNVDELQHGDYVVVTEGEMDCLIALSCGYHAVSVPDGAPANEVGDKPSVKYDYLADMPKDKSKIILAVDNDNAGKNLFQDLKIRLGEHRCFYVVYPSGLKDLNEVFCQFGENGVVNVLDNAKPIEVEGLYTLHELPPLPVYEPCSVGIPKLDRHMKIRQADFSVVTGIPSHGKSTFVNCVAMNIAKKYDWHICFASFEQPPQSEHLRALRTLYNGHPHSCQEAFEINSADKFIQNHFSFIVPKPDMDGEADLTWLLDKMAASVKRYGSKMVVIDPWNEIEHFYDKSLTMTNYIGHAIRRLKRFARDYQVHVMVIAHPAKIRKDKDGNYPIPTAYDIAESANWYNKPEQVIVVHKEENKTLIRVAKSRYHYAIGIPGDAILQFNDHDLTFS